jgi:site-specific recombinase XerD
MTINSYFRVPKVIQRLHEGPLGEYIDLYAAQLLREGHCYQSGTRCIRIVGDFSQWLARKRVISCEVDEYLVEQYLCFRAQCQKPFGSDRPALFRFLALLQEVDVIAPPIPVPAKPLDKIEQDFERYLLRERGLSQTSVIRHRPPLRMLLQEYCPEGVASFLRLSAADIVRFITDHAHDQSPRTARSMCWTLRAFTRYLLYKGFIVDDLAVAVPSVRTWRFGPLPEHLSPFQIQLILDSCDRTSAIGKRDYAVLLLLARLGLRANEIATLTLETIDWHSGLLTIQGKGRQFAIMPILSDLGIALADYLQYGCWTTASRRVFIRSLAPHRGFTKSTSITMIAVSALERAGVDVCRKGTHLFRHSLATQLLGAGASLTEIGQVLRHKNHDTTRIYAKVNISALRQLGLAWPGGVQ